MNLIFKILLKILLIFALIVIPIFMLIVLCTTTNLLFEKARNKYHYKKLSKKKDKNFLKKTIAFYNQCKKFVKLHSSIISAIFFICIMLGFPIAFQNNQMNISTELKKYIKIGTSRDWFRFWSSYIGSIISILFAFYNTKWQFKKNKYENDYKQFAILMDYNSKYIDIIYGYRQELEKIKNESYKDKYNDLKKFVEKKDSEHRKYLDVYNKMLIEISSLNYTKAKEIIEDYSIKNLEFTKKLNLLMSERERPQDWDDAAMIAHKDCSNFLKLDCKILKLREKCRSKS